VDDLGDHRITAAARCTTEWEVLAPEKPLLGRTIDMTMDPPVQTQQSATK
jgi:hypothetical protein